MTRFFCIVALGLLAMLSPLRADQVADDALFRAALSGSPSDIDAALKLGANLKATLAGMGPQPIGVLTVAAVAGNDAALKHFLSLSSWPNDELANALFTAITVQQANVVGLILERLPRASLTDMPWVLALARRPPAVMADGYQIAIQNTVLHKAIPPPPDVGWSWLSAGRFAVDDNDPALAILASLVAAGADVNRSGVFKDDPNGTPILAAASVGDLLMVRSLQKLGATIPVGVSIDKLDVLVLIGASRSGNIAAVKFLLDSGVNPSAASLDGQFALPAALQNSRTDIARLLLAKHADPNLFGKGQLSPLDRAIQSSDQPMTEALLAAGAKPVIDHGGRAWPLRSAARIGDKHLVDILLASGAKLMERDSEGRTVLHDYGLSDNALVGDVALFNSSLDHRGLDDDHYELVRYLGRLQFDFSAQDRSQRTVLVSAIGRDGQSGAGLVSAILDAGSPPFPDAVWQAISERDAQSLDQIVRRKPDLTDPQYVDEAFNRISQNPDMAKILLANGAALNKSLRYLDDAAEAGAIDVVSQLLSRGIGPDGDEFSEPPIERALRRGHGNVAAILFEKGAKVEGTRDNKGSVLHDLVLDDISAGPAEIVIGTVQQTAIADLVNAGFDAQQKDRDGLTPIDLAKAHPDTLTRLQAALSKATTTQAALHDAARRDDLATAKRLKDEGANLNELDGLGRTALTLALQLGRDEIAQFLLESGAEFTLEPRNALQSADVDFASKPRLAAAFMVRLLETQLVNIKPDDAAKNPALAINKFNANQAFALPYVDWTISCNLCGAPSHISANYNAPNSPLTIERFDKGGTTKYWATQSDIFPIHVVFPNGGSLGIPPVGVDVLFLVSARLNIPGCEFDFATSPTCFPEIKVTNPNVGSTLQVKTANGFAPLDPAAVVNAKQGDINFRIDPGKNLVLDRSLGPIEVTIQPVTSTTFSLQLEVDLPPGPPISISPGLSTEERAAVYGQLAKWKEGFEGYPENAQLDAIVKKKALATAIHVLSAMAVDKNYPSHIRDRLQLRAQDVAALNRATLELRDAILSQSELTKGDIDLLIARVDALQQAASGTDKTALDQMKSELVAARDSVINSGAALRVFSENFFSDVDRVVRDYQTLGLELAQYVLPGDLDKVVPDETRNSISNTISQRDVIIKDSALEGQGDAVRTALGLPSPAQ